MNKSQGAIHKRRPKSRWEGGLTMQTFYGQRRFFRCGCLDFLVQKISDFSKFMVCAHGQVGGGLSQCGHFFG